MGINQRQRPVSTRTTPMSKKVYRNFLFNGDRDKDILDWLDLQPNRSKMVRIALHAYMNSEQFEITLEDVMTKLENISEQVTNIKVVSNNNEPIQNEPQDVVNKLKRFGL